MPDCIPERATRREALERIKGIRRDRRPRLERATWKSIDRDRPHEWGVPRRPAFPSTWPSDVRSQPEESRWIEWIRPPRRWRAAAGDEADPDADGLEAEPDSAGRFRHSADEDGLSQFGYRRRAAGDVMARLSASLRSELRLFAFFLANGTVAEDLLGEGWPYDSIFAEPSELERVFAIWGNVVEVDERGEVTESARATRRAAQYIRRFVDPAYVVEPPFEPWELELHL